MTSTSSFPRTLRSKGEQEALFLLFSSDNEPSTIWETLCKKTFFPRNVKNSNQNFPTIQRTPDAVTDTRDWAACPNSIVVKLKTILSIFVRLSRHFYLNFSLSDPRATIILHPRGCTHFTRCTRVSAIAQCPRQRARILGRIPATSDCLRFP